MIPGKFMCVGYHYDRLLGWILRPGGREDPCAADGFAAGVNDYKPVVCPITSFAVVVESGGV